MLPFLFQLDFAIDTTYANIFISKLYFYKMINFLEHSATDTVKVFNSIAELRQVDWVPWIISNGATWSNNFLQFC